MSSEAYLELPLQKSSILDLSQVSKYAFGAYKLISESYSDQQIEFAVK